MSKSIKVRTNRRELYKNQTDFMSNEFNGCLRKTTYFSERIAQREAEYLMSTVAQGKTLRSYKCDSCKNWHHTSKPLKGTK
jgi:hypothetical protein